MDTNDPVGTGDLRDAFHGLVEGQQPSPLLLDRTRSRVRGAERAARVRRYGAFAGAAAAAVLAIVVLAPASNDDVTVEVSPRETTDVEPSTTTTTTGEPTVLGVTELPSTTTSTPFQESPLATPPCRNSTDPACGPFSWDPAPPVNQPIALDARLSAVQVAVGQEVVLTNVVTDPDAADVRDWVQWGDEEVSLIPPKVELPCALYGPWDTPLAVPGRLKTTYRHSYTQPGTYAVLVYVESFTTTEVDCYNLFDDVTQVTLTITVV